MSNRIFLALAAGACSACATAGAPPPVDVLEALRTTSSYSADLTVGLKGPELRGRATVLIGFVRPDRLRIEVPGPTGARVLLVVAGGRLTAVFPPQRAVFAAPATAETLGDVTGVRLGASDIMDLLLGTRPEVVSDYRADWGDRVPRRVRATIAQNETRLDVRIKDPRIDPKIPEAAFAPPPHPGYRSVTAEEARELWVVKR